MNAASEQALRELEAFHLGMMPAIQAASTAVMHYNYADYAERLKKYIARFSDLEFSKERINQIPSGIIVSREIHGGRGQRHGEYKKLGEIVVELQTYIREKGVIAGAITEPLGIEPSSEEGLKVMLKYEQENRVALIKETREAQGKLFAKEDELERTKKELESSRNEAGRMYKSAEDANERARQFTSKENEELIAAKAEVEAVKAEYSSFKEEIQKKEITASSNEFRVQADASKVAAYWWMAGVFISLAIFIGILFSVVFSDKKELFDIAADISNKAKGINSALEDRLIMIEVVKKVSAKVVLFSMGVYLISFLVKNYNAHMHNHIINAQKANALRSTVELIGTAKQDEGNDKIILQATQAIFTTQKSGYQGADSEPANPSVITNVIEAVSGGKKAS